MTNSHVCQRHLRVAFFVSAGCAVTAGDGGVDAAEANGNGIACSGTTAATDPLCTEQFEKSALASLKVVPAAGR